MYLSFCYDRQIKLIHRIYAVFLKKLFTHQYFFGLIRAFLQTLLEFKELRE
jgi:hypothetical protein